MSTLRSSSRTICRQSRNRDKSVAIEEGASIKSSKVAAVVIRIPVYDPFSISSWILGCVRAETMIEQQLVSCTRWLTASALSLIERRRHYVTFLATIRRVRRMKWNLTGTFSVRSAAV